jgi:hypothetical protein
MHHVTIVTGVILCAIGAFGYFWTTTENPSPTALIPAAFGAVLIVLGIVGFILAGGRGFMKLGLAASDDLSVARPVRMVLLMAIVCLIYVALCVNSFLAARRRRAASGD